MNKKTDPLASLFSSDVRAINRQKLAELLKPFLIIDESSKEFSFHDTFNALKSNAQKIEIILAAVKARALFFNEDDGITQGELIDLSIMADGSVKSTLKRLYDSHKIKKDKGSRYFIPAHRIPKMVKQFNN
ncbi:MAG: hypothetical protein KAV41_01305 [Candidatus Pacebacteria bacterium]|nr:hypothetical protein [Candidatus Paceibacterota bacterium]